MRSTAILVATLLLSACAGLPNRDPLIVDVAGIDSLPGEGLEIRLQVAIRVQNPNDAPVQFRGTALDLDLNGRRAASGVSDTAGEVPRYGETVIYVPVTISAFNIVNQVIGFINNDGEEIDYRIRGKLDGGLFATRRFVDEGTLSLDLPARGL